LSEEPQDFLSVEEAVDAVRQEKLIENLEDEAAEIEESEPRHGEHLGLASASDDYPAWALMEDRVLDVIDDAEPDSPDSNPAEPQPQSSLPEQEDSSEATVAAETADSPDAPRHASLRDRPSATRFQRKRRWSSRKQDRREQGHRRPRATQRETPKALIGDMLKEGQEIIVQIAKEPLGKKGARITSHVALPGRYIVFMPTLDHVGVSRKISSDEERLRLKRIIVEHTRNLSGGFIVRTAGEGRSEEDLRQDVQFLVNLWKDIKTRAEKSAAPALLHHDLDLTLRTLRDQLSDEFQAIWVDNEQAYEQVVRLVQKFQPTLVHRARLYTKDVPLFEETGVQDEINKALKPKVWLKSGGYIVINQTEALVAIDVNTGKFVGKSNRLEDTIVKTNVEAIQEIVRQIRLRDLGGIIVIDFIDMDERKNRQKVMSTLEEAMRADKAPSKILAFNEFGLLAITRKRVRQSLERTLCQPCGYCTGSGLVKAPSTVCLEILTEARKVSSELEGKQVTLRVNPEVGKALKSRENGVLEALEEITGQGVIIRNEEAVHIENFYFD
jgi:ribonuclease G